MSSYSQHRGRGKKDYEACRSKRVPKQFLDLVDLAMKGEDVVIIKNDQPLVKLVRAAKEEVRRQFGSAAGLITIAEDFDSPLQDFAEYQ